MKKIDLEDRFIDFTIRISNVVDEIDNSKLGTHIAGQLIRSGSSPALNYGDAQSAVRQLADRDNNELHHSN